MSLKLKLFLILIPALILSNHIADYLSKTTQIPRTVLSILFIATTGWFLLTLIIDFLASGFKLKCINNHPVPRNLEDIIKLLKVIDYEYENTQKTFIELMNIVEANFLILNSNSLKISQANQIAFKTFGKDIIGKSLESLNVFSKMLEALEFTDGKYRGVRNNFIISFNGNIYKASIKPHFWEGRIQYFFLILKNINQDMELEIKVREFNIQISHQIKTPITSILNASDILLKDKSMSQETLKQFLPMIYKQANKLAKFSKSMGKLWDAKVANEAQVLISNEIDLQQLINKILYNLKDVLIANDIHISLNASRSSLPFITTNAPLQLLELLTQLFESFISKNIKNNYLEIKIGTVITRDNRALKLTIKDFIENKSVIAIRKLQDSQSLKHFIKSYQDTDKSRCNILHKIKSKHNCNIKINHFKGIGDEYLLYFPIQNTL